MAVLTPLDMLRMMVDADHEPLLSNDELHTLLESVQQPRSYSVWEPATAYTVGSLVIPSPRNGLVYEVTVAGTSGAAQPPFSDDLVLTDNGVTWVVSSLVDDAYNLNKAAAQGWRIKAGRVNNRYDLADDTSKTMRSQQFKHCMEMYKSYRSGMYGSIPVTSESVRFQ